MVKIPKKNLFPHIPRKCDIMREEKYLESLKKRREKSLEQKIKSKKNNKAKVKKLTVKQVEAVWSEIIKIKAGYKSELSGTPAQISSKTGKPVGLQSHHIAGKRNYWLRFNLENGICLTAFSEHLHGVHASDPPTSLKYHRMILSRVGMERWNKLLKLKYNPPEQKKTLQEWYEELTKILQELKNGQTSYNKYNGQEADGRPRQKSA